MNSRKDFAHVLQYLIEKYLDDIRLNAIWPCSFIKACTTPFWGPSPF